MSTEITIQTPRFQCRHVFTDGRRCGSPALRTQNFCYFHHTSRRPIQDAPTRKRRQSSSPGPHQPVTGAPPMPHRTAPAASAWTSRARPTS